MMRKMEGNDAAKQAEQNLKDIRKWAKDEKNTICADCKRNKRRWMTIICYRTKHQHIWEANVRLVSRSTLDEL